MARVGRPVDKVYSEFLQGIFNEFIHQRDNYANRGLKLGGLSNGILNYKASKKRVELAKVVKYGSQYAVTVWKSSTYKNWSINDYYYYVVKISDIEAYKKEKYKL